MNKTIILILAAIMSLGICANGQAYSKDLEKQANGGDTRAMVAVGDAYMQGNGVGKDLKKAEKWYKKAIDKDDNLVAYERMADLYRSWDGIEKDMKKVSELAYKGGMKGNPRLALESVKIYIDTHDAYGFYGSDEKIYETASRLLHVAVDSGLVEGAELAMAVDLERGDLYGAVLALKAYKKHAGANELNDAMKNVAAAMYRTGNESTYERISKVAETWADIVRRYDTPASTIKNSRPGLRSKEYLDAWAKYHPLIEKGDFESMSKAYYPGDFLTALWYIKQGKTERAEELAGRIETCGQYFPENLTRLYLIYSAINSNRAVRFFDKVVSEKPQSVVDWLTNKEATKMLTADRKELQHGLEFKSGTHTVSRFVELLPEPISNQDINGMLQAARRQLEN